MLVLFSFLALGVLCAKLGFLDEHTRGKLNKIVLNICAPAMVFNSVLRMSYSYSIGDILTLLGEATIFNALMVLLSFVFAALFYRKRAGKRTLQFMSAFGNCVFMGFTVVASIYGDGAVFLAAICSIPFNVFSFSVGVFILGGKQKEPLWKLLLNPPFLANIISLLLFLLPVDAPEPVLEIFESLGGMVVPLSMMLVGAALAAMPVKDVFTDTAVYLLALAKLILAPLAVFVICRLFIRDSLFLGIIVISAAMPSASISPILAMEYGGDPTLASQGVFLTTLFSLLTIPLLLSLLL